MKISHKNHVFGAVLFVLIALVLWLRITVEATHYISPDSEFYLRVAENILAGKGLVAPDPDSYPFDEHTPEVYFAEWAAGYPFLIAFLSSTSGLSVFSASKCLNIISLLLIYFILYKRIGSRAWFPFLYFCSFAMLELYSYSWSEPIFLVFVLLLIINIERSWYQKSKYTFLRIGLILIVMFLLRYAALIYFVGVTVMLGLAFFLGRKRVSLHYLFALILAVTVVISYLFFNYLQAGFSTGGERFFPEEISNISFVLNLFQGLINSLSIARNFYFKWEWLYFVLMLLQLSLCAFIIKSSNLIAKPFLIFDKDIYAFWGSSFFYLIMVVVLRRVSPFDWFDYRILSPFLLPFYLGLFISILKHEEFFQKTYKWITAFMLLSLLINLPKVFLYEKLKQLISYLG